MKQMQNTVWKGSLRMADSCLGGEIKQARPATGTEWPPQSSSYHWPSILTTRLPLNFLYSNWLMKYRLLIKADCRMMGMLLVQNSFIGQEPVPPLIFLFWIGRLILKPWKQMTMRKTRIVAKRLLMLGRLFLQKAYWMAASLSLLVARPWNKATTAPSYS